MNFWLAVSSHGSACRRAPVSALLALFALAFAPQASALPSYEEVRQDFRSSETQILSREGEAIQRIRTDATVRRGQWIALADVSPALRTALVLSEDKRFFEHSGVDWGAVSSAAWGNLWNQRTRGASTITMQLAGLLDGDWRQGPGGRTVVQKAGQAVAAQVLDRRWRKDQILEAYLNLVPFRGELVGIDALSRTLFDKAPHGLDEREAAVAAALVRAPNARPAQVAERACGVLKDMRKSQATSCDALDLFTTGALQRRAFDPSEGIAPHYSRQLLAQLRNQGTDVKSARLRSTLSAPLQRVAVETLTRHLRELRGRNVEDGAIVVLDNATGEVLAWVGSSGMLSQASEVDGVLAWRQPGSTLKPFLYAEAIAEKRLTAASLIEDSPAYIPTANGLYIPQNYDRHFKGWVSARTALAASLNVPAVRTLVMVGTDRFHEQLKALGMPLRESGGYYGYSLALGSAEIPLLYLTNGYRTLANGGRWTGVQMQPAAITKDKSPTQPASKQVIDEGAAFIVGDMLSDTNARVRTFGTDSVLNTRFWTAVKTGTSKDMRDNWALGWSQRYTVGVWVGNASGAPMHDVSGTSGAAPIWAELMVWLHRSERNRIPKPPANVVKTAVQFGALDTAGSWLESPREEWFLRGTEQKLFAIDSVESAAAQASSTSSSSRGKKAATQAVAQGMPARILSPVSGTIVALDPDIPPARQRVQFIATDAPDGVRWLFNGKEQGRGARWGWLPWPGRYKVELIDAKGQVLDETAVEVRGAGVRQQSQQK
ncbi:penicillin-binding protein 1C [Diaphorobacter sp. HDW4A]|uniref:penicillin-binding protein 1C n=1 Tax=Diaphorobacter sp. HDW4A TaxID=2714924 RepID=UPI00140DCE09|nr:penicillin-binding protein 1C [Diaphorobacter sp. HDW4A]QIL78658.1 penicillin-binding protein 1C [Diaphorobacter sp. HDW4A]